MRRLVPPKLGDVADGLVSGRCEVRDLVLFNCTWYEMHSVVPIHDMLTGNEIVGMHASPVYRSVARMCLQYKYVSGMSPICFQNLEKNFRWDRPRA